MADGGASGILQRAGAVATAAVQHDARGDKKQARLLYIDAAGLLQQAVATMDATPSTADDAPRTAALLKMQEYLSRAEALSTPDQRAKIDAVAATAGSASGTGSAPPASDAVTRLLAAGDAAKRRARELHGDLRFSLAERSFETAAEKYLQALAGVGSEDTGLRDAIRARASEALSAAEALRRAIRTTLAQPDDVPSMATPVAAAEPPRPVASPASSKGGRKNDFTAQEMAVLKHTSRINGKVYLPWLPSDAREHLGGGGRYVDPDGPLQLSPKQRARFHKWVRPTELSQKPIMVYLLSSQSIRQTIVSDCSFVSSLAIGADFERRFKRSIITCSIFPQDTHGKPVVNPHGKYLVRLHFNGVWRKVMIDDTLPADRDGNLLCSFSSHRSELWISLIEKAYLKAVGGGYDFPGSNSSIDLHALTGWIPDRCAIQDCTDEYWATVFRSLHAGHSLVTVATGALSESEADRAGLVPSHAYAVLDMRQIGSLRLLKLKNPWSHLRWKGRFSPDDTKSWTAEFKRKLGYDQDSAQQFDNGVFWIDWPSVRRFFDVMYMSHDPKTFLHRRTLHDVWHQHEGPVKDTYNVGYNPQFFLNVDVKEKATVWVLLSRHITTIADFAHNKEYITLHVFRSGHRVYYTEDAEIQGTKINSPHYLVKLPELPAGKHRFTLVVSQYEKANTLRYTLRTFSTASFQFGEVVDIYKHEKKITSEWTAATAGGPTNDRLSHLRNPAFSVKLADGLPGTIRMQLEAPRQFYVGLAISGGEDVLHSGAYRPGFCVLEIPNCQPGVEYIVIPSTYEKNQIGPFFLTAFGDRPVTITPKAT
eukprot:m.210933 g.210933  ORF g.210933 m.210933 type:complete len:820 (-) comp18569_c1_seq2:225-2684(-)